MKYETIKTFILVILVGTSLFLSFILWSYQPNYKSLSDPDYVNEVDIGGTDRTRAELIEPVDIAFHSTEDVFGFKRALERRLFYKDMQTWVLYDHSVREYNGFPKMDQYVEIIFPDKFPIELIGKLLTFNENIEQSAWSFDRIYIMADDASKSLKFTIPSTDDRVALTAIVEKSERYTTVSNFFTASESLQEYITLEEGKTPIYLPKDPNEMSEKTLVATMIPPELLIDALFQNPSMVTQNLKEAYFTDGQRGMKTDKERRNMEFINPLSSYFERMDLVELLDQSINHVNEHRGWTNDFVLDKLGGGTNSVTYRMNYEGYPVFTGRGNAIIEQQWQENDLHEYKRPLVRIGNLLSSHKIELPTGEEIIAYLRTSQHYDLDKIEDIKVGYMLRHLQDGRSLILEPKWYVLYEKEWKQLNIVDELDNIPTSGGG